MTKDQAKTKWCPMWRIDHAAAINNHVAAKCIGSDCMLWRTEIKKIGDAYVIYNYCGPGGKP